MKRLIICVLVICLVYGHGATDLQAQHLGKVHERTFVMPDGLELHAWIHESDAGDDAPLIICLPQRRATHRSFDRFYVDLSRYIRENSEEKLQLPHVMVLDLRGHGESVTRGDSTLSYETMSTDEYQKIPGDVVAVLNAVDTTQDDPLLARIRQGKRLLIGASIGANSAIMATAEYPGIEKVVMLSPGEDYRGLTPLEAAKSFQGEMLILVSKGDRYSYTSSRMLSRAVRKRCDVQQWEGMDHGTDIVNNNGVAMEQLLEWLFRK